MFKIIYKFCFFFKQQTLIELIKNNDFSKILFLINSGIFLNKTFGETPLNAAIENSNLKVVELLIQKNVNVNEAGANGIFPVQLATYMITYGHTKENIASRKILSLLLENHANPKLFGKKHYGVPALADAAFYNDTELVALLLTYGADANIMWQYSWTRFNDDILRLLVQNSSNPPQEVVEFLADINESQ
jgi:ankyrin repeat protein